MLGGSGEGVQGISRLGGQIWVLFGHSAPALGWLLLEVPCVKLGLCLQRDAGWAAWGVWWCACGELLQLIPKRIGRR